MSKNPCAEKSKRKRKSKNTELPNTATASQKRIKFCKAVNNEDTEDSNADNNRHTSIHFSSPLVTECTETGEKVENRSNINDNNPETLSLCDNTPTHLQELTTQTRHSPCPIIPVQRKKK